MMNLMKRIYLEQTTSTNDIARQMANEGASHLTHVWANEQTAGRGRQGKVWQTYPDTSIAVSFIVREGACEQLPLLASIAIARTIGRYAPCSIKWPNDILAGGEKLSGALVERFGHGDNIYYIVGIGINVNNPHEDCIGTTIEKLSGQKQKREDVLDILTAELDSVLKTGWPDLKATYINMCITLGKEVTWQHAEASQIGTATGIMDDGSLVLRSNNGQELQIRSGEIIMQATSQEQQCQRKPDTP